MRVHKCNHRGERRITYEGDVVSRDQHRVIVRAPWTLPPLTLPYVTFYPGDIFIETHYADRWYNVHEVHQQAGDIKGWYADIARPARISDDDIEYDDLALDMWMNRDGLMLTLDEDEFEATLRELTPVEIASAHGAVAALRRELTQCWRAYANDRIGNALTQRDWTLGAAESCTGGLLGDVITNRAGSSAYFAGGVISYSNQIKHHILGVSEATLHRYGAVSEQCALEMARGVRHVLNIDVGISTTGIAGPDGGSATKPVGLVYVGLSSPLGERVIHRVWSHDRIGNKEASVDEALRALLNQLTHIRQ